MGITASFEKASENNNVLHISNVNDETRNNIPDELSELSVPETRVDRQPHTHHNLLQQMSLIEELINWKSNAKFLIQLRTSNVWLLSAVFLRKTYSIYIHQHYFQNLKPSSFVDGL